MTDASSAALDDHLVHPPITESNEPGPDAWPDGPLQRVVREPLSIAWLLFIVVLLGWSAWHLGATHLTATVRTADGSLMSVPDTFATVDHPFHVARAQTLLDSLRDRQILRWVGSHEGGYPVEFYPLGVPWLTVVVWSISLGTLAIASAFKLVVIGIFLAPVLAFAGLGRLDRVALPIAGLALVAHLAVPGEWWSGGYTETVEWGLITNVAAYVAAFGFLAALLAFVLQPSRLTLLLSIGLSVFAVATNTRSTIALVCVGLGVIASVLIQRGVTRETVRQLVARYAVVAVPALLLSAPLWLNSLRFSKLYEFIQYEFYDGLSAYWQSSVNAVSWPVVTLAIIGFVVALLDRSRLAPMAATWTLVFYVVATTVLGGLGPNGGLIAQLEATRLMPFQRLLMIYLAATAVMAAVRLLGRSRRSTVLVSAGLLTITVLLTLVVVIRPVSSLPLAEQSMFPVETTANSQYADLILAVRVADRIAAPGTAIFIAGSELSWHQPMWAPTVTERPLRYNDWLWLWQTWHRSPALEYVGQAIAPTSLDDALRPEELARHGVGAVIALTPQIEALTDQEDDLIRQDDAAGYAVYRVQDSVPVVTSDAGTTVESNIGNGRITATVEGNAGTVTIRETWFPRWEATVDGKSADITRDASGQMRIEVPAGRVALEVVYGVDALDILGRVGSIIGLLLTLLLMSRPRLGGVWSGMATAGSVRIRDGE